MKKVLFIIHRLTPGGAEEMVVQQVNRLDHNQFDVFLLTLAPEIDNQNNLLSQLQIPSEKIKTIVFSRWYSVHAWKQLISWLRQEQFDVVYSHLWLANLIGRIAAVITGVPRRIVTEHNVYATRSWLERRINTFLGRFFTSRVVAVSHSVKEYLVKKENIPSEKIQVIYNGIDLEKFHPKNTSTSLRRQLGFADDDFLVLSLGKVSQQKGYDRLVATAQILAEKSEGQNIHFVIAGRDEGKNWSSLYSEAPKNVHFLGYRTDTPELLATSNLFFMPSVWEGFGLALVEAMAMGKPVVVSDLPTFHEIMAESHCGFFASISEQFAESILKLSQNTIEYKKCAEAGQARAQDFSLSTNVRNLEKLLNLL